MPSLGIRAPRAPQRRRGTPCARAAWPCRLAMALLALGWLGAARGAEVLLRDGTSLSGGTVEIARMELPPSASPPGGKPIVVVNDQLRRVYVPQRTIDEIREDSVAAPPVHIRIRQPDTQSGNPVASVGAPLRITDFDEYGRRIFTMATDRGPLSIIQGIVEITPLYTRVMAIEGENRRKYLWDMRMATTSLTREELQRILRQAVRRDSLDDRMQVYRLYLQLESYSEAGAELEAIINDFPEKRREYEPYVRDLRQLMARRVLAEIRLLRESGQHQRCYALLRSFPAEGVAGEILQQVQQMLGEFDAQRQQGQTVLKLVDELVAQLPTETAAEVKPLRDELVAELNYNTLDRMAAFLNLAGDANLQPDEKLALALSGWMLGADASLSNLPVTLSLYEVRGLVRQYVNETLALNRKLLLERIQRQEAGSPEYVSRLLRYMKPPVETPPQEIPGYYELSVDTQPGAAPVRYYVQLPPEYDPLRKYPAVVTLHGAATTPQLQIDWWAGGRDRNGNRQGQGTRHGYIVIAPAWGATHQRSYEYSLREHTAVLATLRDACRRFSIDTDRVFLSGHSMGGEAAWDIALAHPDLWSGVVPIVPRADKYVNLYWPNARYVPLYLIYGELDGSRLADSYLSLNRYMERGYPVRVCEYLGRGHENFSDEVQSIYQWMNRQRRDFYPREFDCVTLRPWDNYFWWIEMHGLPEASMIHPEQFDEKRSRRPATVNGKLYPAGNSISVSSSAAQTTLWLSPQMVDFSKPLSVLFRGKTRRQAIAPDLETLLEDARTRADRQHQFWAKIPLP